MADEVKGNYAVLVSPNIFDEQPQFAVQIATCLHLWSEIEYAMADLVFSSANAAAPVAVRNYFSVFTSAQRLDHAEMALTGTEYRAEFARLRPKIAKLAAERARIAHGRWGFRPERRDEILLFPHAGERYFKGKQTSAWTLTDFQHLAGELVIVANELTDLDTRFLASQR